MFKLVTPTLIKINPPQILSGTGFMIMIELRKDSNCAANTKKIIISAKKKVTTICCPSALNWRDWPAYSTEKPAGSVRRSEEHTSELQSRGHLVCRLLLEKKNERQRSTTS